MNSLTPELTSAHRLLSPVLGVPEVDDGHVILNEGPLTGEADSGIRDVELESPDGEVHSHVMLSARKHIHDRVEILLGELITTIKVQTGISVEASTGMSLADLRANIVPVIGDYHLSKILHSSPPKTMLIDEEPIEHDLKSVLNILVATHGNVHAALQAYRPKAA